MKKLLELHHYVLTGEACSLSTGVPSKGGYKIMQQLTDESVMRRICTVKTTYSKEYKHFLGYITFIALSVISYLINFTIYHLLFCAILLSKHTTYQILTS